MGDITIYSQTKVVLRFSINDEYSESVISSPSFGREIYQRVTIVPLLDFSLHSVSFEMTVSYNFLERAGILVKSQNYFVSSIFAF